MSKIDWDKSPQKQSEGIIIHKDAFLQAQQLEEKVNYCIERLEDWLDKSMDNKGTIELKAKEIAFLLDAMKL